MFMINAVGAVVFERDDFALDKEWHHVERFELTHFNLLSGKKPTSSNLPNEFVF